MEAITNMGYPKLELGLSAMPKDHLLDCLAYNNLKVCLNFFVLVHQLPECFLCYLLFLSFYCQGIILSKALKSQKDVEDKSIQIAFVNLRSEVIDLRHQALAKDDILISLVNKLKESWAELAKFSKESSVISKLEEKKDDLKRIAN
jgi:hypothetical protein